MIKEKKILLSELKLNDGTYGFAKNPRFIRDERFKKLVESIKDFPEAMPARGIVVDERGVILGGNMRYRACLELGMKEIPEEWVHRLIGLSVDQKRRFIIMDNRQYGDDDFDLLVNEWDIEDLLKAGFDEKELLGIMESDEQKDAEVQVDQAAELNKTWKVGEGDMWQIGENRLLCGDSTKAEDVKKIMDREQWDFVTADPPYGKLKIFDKEGTCLHAKTIKTLAKSKNYGEYKGHKTFTLSPFLKAIGGIPKRFCLWGGNYFADVLPITTSWICWDKSFKGQSIYSDFELAWTNLGCPARIFHHTWQGMIRDGEKIERQHPTQKPVELYKWIFEKFTAEKELIFEPFMGSGSVMVACQNINHKCYGIEITPNYCAVILQRMKDAFSGIKIEKIK